MVRYSPASCKAGPHQEEGLVAQTDGAVAWRRVGFAAVLLKIGSAHAWGAPQTNLPTLTFPRCTMSALPLSTNWRVSSGESRLLPCTVAGCSSTTNYLHTLSVRISAYSWCLRPVSRHLTKLDEYHHLKRPCFTSNWQTSESSVLPRPSVNKDKKRKSRGC